MPPRDSDLFRSWTPAGWDGEVLILATHMRESIRHRVKAYTEMVSSGSFFALLLGRARRTKGRRPDDDDPCPSSALFVGLKMEEQDKPFADDEDELTEESDEEEEVVQVSRLRPSLDAAFFLLSLHFTSISLIHLPPFVLTSPGAAQTPAKKKARVAKRSLRVNSRHVDPYFAFGSVFLFSPSFFAMYQFFFSYD